jgi:hypothetical protein
MPWTRSIHLDQWADELASRGQLPLLVRRLISRTISSLKILDFPAFEQIGRTGFDGTVGCNQGNQYVPPFESRWELGTGKDPRKKANEDFNARTEETLAEAQRKLAFVFVTPRPWSKGDRNAWIEEKSAKSSWREIRVHDGNDLEHWLEAAPDIDIWFSRHIGKAPKGAQDLNSYWDALRLIASPALAPCVFTASRDLEAAAVSKWLSDTGGSLFMRTSGLTDGLDFLAAMSRDKDQEKLQNAIIIYDMDAWRDLAACREPLILIAAPTLELQATDVSEAVGKRHHVFTSGPRGNLASQSDQELRPQDFYAVSKALVESGYPESAALGFAKAMCGSSSILKRIITEHRETRFPAWSRDEVRASLAPLAMIGGWRHVSPEPPPRDPALPQIGSDPPIDVLLVSELMGCKPEDLDGIVARWQVGTEPLLMRFGNIVLVASREDSWYLLGGMINREQLQCFCRYACLVLEEDNPAFQLEVDQRWMANLLGKTHSLSDELRTSIVETLVLMALYPTADRPVANVDFGAAVREVMERILPASANWQRWASFKSDLIIIAEADPDYFLARVEGDLASTNPALAGLFQGKGHSIFGGGWLHVHFIWALECLAWSGQYLSRVSVCLAKLAVQDNSSPSGNNPHDSLHRIFLPWLPHTTASIPERIDAITAILKAEPGTGWKLLCSLLPTKMSTFAHTTYMPRWRRWADGWSRNVVNRSSVQYHLSIADLVFLVAGADPAKWAQVLDGMLRYSKEITNRVLTILDSPSLDASDQEATFSLWEAIRELISWHQRYPDAPPVLDDVLHARLVAIRDRLAPTDPVMRHQWLFHRQAELPHISRLDFSAHDEALYDRRLVAMQEIIAAHGNSIFQQLLERGYDPSNTGWIVGAIDSVSWHDVPLPSALDPSNPRSLDFATTFIANRFRRFGRKFVDAILCSEWTPEQIAMFARSLPCTTDTWDWVEGISPEAGLAYWRAVRLHVHHPSFEEVNRISTSLMGVGRGFSSIDFLCIAMHYKVALSSDLIADVLNMASSERNTELPDKQNSPAYDVQQLINRLQQDVAFDRLRLARIEWAYLSMLEPDYSQTRPDTLIGIIESEPALFVDLLCKVYSGNHEGREVGLTEQELAYARNARLLLHGLTRLPGTRADRSINMKALRDWTTQVRRMASECDREAICDGVLAELFVNATRRRDADWPPLDVAQLVEEIGTESFIRGFKRSIVNTRGVISRNPASGGDLERREAARCRHLADYVRVASNKVAEAFLEMARRYEAEAKVEDEGARRERVGR